MITCDINKRPYATLAELRSGDIVEVDDGFNCLRAGTIHEVHRNSHGLYIECDEGQHYLAGQADDGEHCVGVYHTYPVDAPSQ